MITGSPTPGSLNPFGPGAVYYDPLRRVGLTPPGSAPSSPTPSSSTSLPSEPIPPPQGPGGSVVPRRVEGPSGPVTGRGVDVSVPNPYINAGLVRATGKQATGPNAAWAQNLASYAGGNYERQGGSLNINPFGVSPFSSGVSSGLGTAPIMGTPNTLLNIALGTTLTNPEALAALFPGFQPTALGT